MNTKHHDYQSGAIRKGMANLIQSTLEDCKWYCVRLNDFQVEVTRDAELRAMSATVTTYGTRIEIDGDRQELLAMCLASREVVIL